MAAHEEQKITFGYAFDCSQSVSWNGYAVVIAQGDQSIHFLDGDIDSLMSALRAIQEHIQEH